MILVFCCHKENGEPRRQGGTERHGARVIPKSNKFSVFLPVSVPPMFVAEIATETPRHKGTQRRKNKTVLLRASLVNILCVPLCLRAFVACDEILFRSQALHGVGNRCLDCLEADGKKGNGYRDNSRQSKYPPC